MPIILYLVAAVLAVLNVLGVASVSWWIVAALALAPTVFALVFVGGAALAVVLYHAGRHS
jgi:hypothetical protein